MEDVIYTKAVKEIHEMYLVWISLFPFELSSLQHLKKKYISELPPYNDSRVFEWDENFEGTAPLHTRESFYDYLTQLTLDLLDENTYLRLYRSGKLSDQSKLIEINECIRRLRNDNRRTNSLNLELPYLKHIESWLNDERIFLIEELPLLEKQSPLNKEKSSSSTLQKEYIKYGENSKYKAKHYALLHTILISVGLENPFSLNQDGQHSRAEIEAFAETKYGFPNGQSFYKSFNSIRISSGIQIANMLGSGYKEIIIEISNNNHKVMQGLKKYPN